MNNDSCLGVPLDEIEEDDRVAAVARLHDLYSGGELPHETFCGFLDRVFAARSHTELEAALSALPPLVPLTPPARRLATPLVLRTADSRLPLGCGWQLAADTVISTGFGAARLDLTAASWDSRQINLRLETWGSIEVLVPEGTAVQVAGGSRCVCLEALSPAVPGGLILRISTSGPAGVFRVRHPKGRGSVRVRVRRSRRRGVADRRRSGGRPRRPAHRW